MPIVLPLVTGALLLVFDERRHAFKATISFVSTFTLLGIAIVLLRFADTGDVGETTRTGVYLLGNWPAPPFGIVLVLDRLSALLGFVSTVALAKFLMRGEVIERHTLPTCRSGLRCSRRSFSSWAQD